MCPEIEEPLAPPTPGTAAKPLPIMPPAHYVVYFDQPYLTLMGRAQALDSAREMMPLLTRDGAKERTVR